MSRYAPMGAPRWYRRLYPASHQARRHTLSRRLRGQSLVEFALLLPVFIALVFGVIEFALINASIGAFNFSAQEAARYGAIIGPTDPGPCGSAGPCDLTDINMLNQVILPHTAGIVMAKVITVEVFHAGEGGGCYDGTVTFPCAQETTFSAATGGWTVGWPDNTRDDTLVTADYIGVRITYQYTYLTAFVASFSPQLTLTAISVQRIEPQEYTRIPHNPAAALALAASETAASSANWSLTPNHAPTAVLRPVSLW